MAGVNHPRTETGEAAENQRGRGVPASGVPHPATRPHPPASATAATPAGQLGLTQRLARVCLKLPPGNAAH